MTVMTSDLFLLYLILQPVFFFEGEGLLLFLGVALLLLLWLLLLLLLFDALSEGLLL